MRVSFTPLSRISESNNIVEHYCYTPLVVLSYQEISSRLNAIPALGSQAILPSADMFQITALNKVCNMAPNLMHICRSATMRCNFEVRLRELNEIPDLIVNPAINRASPTEIVGS